MTNPSTKGAGAPREVQVVNLNPRYPYTLAYDFLRAQTSEHNEAFGFPTPKFSRSDCAALCHAIAPCLGMTAEMLAKKIADHAKATGASA